MSLKDIRFKKSYDSDSDDIIKDFYCPALSVSINYSRLTGFFSSTSLAVAAKGIAGLIRNGGSVNLVTSAMFQSEDIEAIKEACENPESILEKTMLRELDNIEDEFVKDHVRALGWMVANKRLRIKVAIVIDEDEYPLDSKSVEKEGIFHQKVGILARARFNSVLAHFCGFEKAGQYEEFKSSCQGQNCPKIIKDE